MLDVLVVMLAGACGAFSRWSATVALTRWFPNSPHPTMIVNLIGCFLFGVLFAALNRYIEGSSTIKLLFLTGFLGAFTTFSTFIFDSVHLIEQQRYWAAASNILVQNLAGMATLAIGLCIGHRL